MANTLRLLAVAASAGAMFAGVQATRGSAGAPPSFNVARAVVSSVLCAQPNRSAVIAPPAATVLFGMLAEAQIDPAARSELRRIFTISSPQAAKAFVIPEGIAVPAGLMSAWKEVYGATVISRAGDLSARAGFDASSVLPPHAEPRIVLAATQYAKEAWSGRPFPRSAVAVRSFHSRGRPRRVRFMTDSRSVEISRVNGLELGALAYASGTRLVFTLGSSESCETASHLAGATFQNVAWAAAPAVITIPEFELATSADMLPIIRRTAPRLVDPSALRIPLSIVASREVATFSVGTNGTVGTAVAYAELTYLEPLPLRSKRVIRLDRPFDYALVDRSGTILFVGAYR